LYTDLLAIFHPETPFPLAGEGWWGGVRCDRIGLKRTFTGLYITWKVMALGISIALEG